MQSLVDKMEAGGKATEEFAQPRRTRHMVRLGGPNTYRILQVTPRVDTTERGESAERLATEGYGTTGDRAEESRGANNP